jgi:hypothetical protein
MTSGQTNDIEQWVDIVGWEGLYQVSSHGRVKSLDRDNRKNKFGRLVPGKILIPTPHYKNGYLSVMLKKERVSKRVTVHRTVAKHFVPNPNNLPEVNHEDGIKSNCNYSNLKWCDRSYNNQHAFNNGLKTGSNRGNFNKTYYNSKPIIAIQDTAIIEFNSIKSCARYLNVERTAVQHSIKRKNICKGHSIYRLND